MKTLFVLTAVVALAPLAPARVWTSVYRCDEITPLEAVDPNHPTVYRDIMVGTRLTIIVSSDAGGYWFGALRLPPEDANDATLSARGYSPELLSYDGSCLEAAGSDPWVMDFSNETGIGFQFNSDGIEYPPSSSRHPAVPGDWFIFDYRAEQVGSCDLRLFDFSIDLNIPIQTLSFTHVPSRDFTGDGIVNFEDFALLARYWRSGAGVEPDSPDTPFDLNGDGLIGMADLIPFSEYWLERTDCNAPATDPNNPSPQI
jgi:hypothetical protein